MGTTLLRNNGKIWLIIGVFHLIGCTRNNEVNYPDYLIERDKFIQIQKDMALAEAMLNTNIENANGEKFDSLYNFRIFKQYGINKTDYDTTLYFYSHHPKLFREIMEEVLEQLNIEKTSIQTEQNP